MSDKVIYEFVDDNFFVSVIRTMLRWRREREERNLDTFGINMYFPGFLRGEKITIGERCAVSAPALPSGSVQSMHPLGKNTTKGTYD